jgi:hypothetical protein
MKDKYNNNKYNFTKITSDEYAWMEYDKVYKPKAPVEVDYTKLLDTIDFKVIEQYVRKKKLNSINKLKK